MNFCFRSDDTPPNTGAVFPGDDHGSGSGGGGCVRRRARDT